MQTVCAHCYTRLTPHHHRKACILCTKCEQKWLAGHPPVRLARPPEWQINPKIKRAFRSVPA